MFKIINLYKYILKYKWKFIKQANGEVCILYNNRYYTKNDVGGQVFLTIQFLEKHMVKNDK